MALVGLFIDASSHTDGPPPVDMILPCPNCGRLHIDGPDERSEGWQNPPHRSHLCHYCGHIWRPADIPTNGVATLLTRSEEHTSELQSLMRISYAVFCLNKKIIITDHTIGFHNNK